MRIYLNTAQQIVNEISTIIKQHINIMDSRGFIIASTDPSRIGNFHEGAKKILDEHLDEFYVTHEEETSTTREGLNLPIVYDDEIIGVVGITGEYKQVYNYGQIVKKMTEILVRESYTREQIRFNKKIETNFLEDWIFRNGMEQGQSFIDRGNALNIDITRPRRAIVLRLNNFQQLAGNDEGQKIIERIEHTLRHIIREDPDNIFLRLSNKQICLVSPRTDDKMKALAEQLADMIKDNYNVTLMIGIDNYSSGTTLVREAFEKANKAAHACISPEKCIMLYDKMNMEIFMDNIPKYLKQEYLDKVFGILGNDDIRQWISILQAYFVAEGSITLAAERLYMHKNTLQYKLNKLVELTGYDVRLPSSAPIFYIAVLFFYDLQNCNSIK